MCYIGTYETLRLFSPLLQSPKENPHATLITLYLNATKEIMKGYGDNAKVPDMRVLKKFLPDLSLASLRSFQGADMYRIWDATNLVQNVEHYFGE